MNKKIKAQWVAALKSGKYKQGKNKLRTRVGSFCCLGVLCNLHAQAHPEIAAHQTKIKTYMGATDTLPNEVVKWAGLEKNNPLIGENSATTCNDVFGYNFTKIANLINDHL